MFFINLEISDIDDGDFVSESDCHGDDTDDGGKSNDDGVVDGNGAFDTKGEADDGDDQTESAAGDTIEFNGSSENEMRVRVIQWHILKGAQC